PPLVILDGYDELPQASGQVFASYINDAERFQEGQAEQGRPVRIIITSRVTLIDKASIPVAQRLFVFSNLIGINVSAGQEFGTKPTAHIFAMLRLNNSLCRRKLKRMLSRY